MEATDENQTSEPTVLFDDAERPRYIVDDDEISSKEGNYLITVGNPSAGKSTLQNALI